MLYKNIFRSSCFPQALENLRNSSESGQLSSQNHQKRYYVNNAWFFVEFFLLILNLNISSRSLHSHIRCQVETVFRDLKASRNGKRDLRTTELIFSLSCKTVVLAAISPEINIDDWLINEWMLTMFAVPSVWHYRKNFQRILQKQGMKFKLNTMVTSKLMLHRTFFSERIILCFCKWAGRFWSIKTVTGRHILGGR